MDKFSAASDAFSKCGDSIAAIIDAAKAAKEPLAEAGDATELRIEQHEDLWEVSGPWIMKLLNDINFDDYESRMYFDRQLRKSGLFERLEEMGIEDGDTVSIYDFEFEYTK